MRWVVILMLGVSWGCSDKAKETRRKAKEALKEVPGALETYADGLQNGMKKAEIAAQKANKQIAELEGRIKEIKDLE